MRPFPLALAACLALTACSGEPEAGPSPSAPAHTPAPTVPPKQTQGARTALLTYLKGVASGDTKVCSAMTPAYERAVFGKAGGCRSGLAAERKRIRPKDLAALKTVSVPVAEAGPEAGTFTVGFQDLEWEGDPARPGGLLAARFTLKRSGGRWLLIP